MSMEEVNERFPLTKYKMWRSSREHEGLPAAGGIAQPETGSRPASIKEMADSAEIAKPDADASRSFPVLSSPTDKPDEPSQHKAPEPSSTVETANVVGEDTASNVATTTTEKPTDVTQSEKSGNGAISEAQPHGNDRHDSDGEEEEDDDPARAPVQQELLDSPGDTCAICLDNIDDDDDVRGLTCGHAFHAGCLDPWLTSRRACCPLCKADYYVPKPRPENALNPDEAQMSPIAQSGSRVGFPVTPHGAMMGRVGGGLPFLSFRSRTATAAASPNRVGTPTLQPEEITADADAGRQRRGLGGSIFGLAGRLRRNRNTHAGSNLPTMSPTSSSPQSPRMSPLPSDTPITPRAPYLVANSISPAATTPMTNSDTPITTNATPSSPSPSPNWRTRLLTATSPPRSRLSTSATSSSFISRLRGGGRNNESNDNYNHNDEANGNIASGSLANSSSAADFSRMGTDAPPVLPPPVLGSGVGMGAGVTPSQLEAGVRA